MPALPTLPTRRIGLRDIEIAAVVFAALAGIYGIATADKPEPRLAIVLLAPAVEAALPLLARWLAPSKVHAARVVALLLVVFYIALAPLGIDNYLYLPSLAALAVVVFLSNRQRWREARERQRG